MVPITIQGFINQSASQANAPGSTNNNVSIVGTKSTAVGVAGPNDAFFANAAQGGVQLSLQGVTADVLANLPAGTKVEITIAPAP